MKRGKMPNNWADNIDRKMDFPVISRWRNQKRGKIMIREFDFPFAYRYSKLYPYTADYTTDTIGIRSRVTKL